MTDAVEVDVEKWMIEVCNHKKALPLPVDLVRAAMEHALEVAAQSCDDSAAKCDKSDHGRAVLLSKAAGIRRIKLK